jgi:hypothetical protein
LTDKSTMSCKCVLTLMSKLWLLASSVLCLGVVCDPPRIQLEVVGDEYQAYEGQNYFTVVDSLGCQVLVSSDMSHYSFLNLTVMLINQSCDSVVLPLDGIVAGSNVHQELPRLDLSYPSHMCSNPDNRADNTNSCMVPATDTGCISVEFRSYYGRSSQASPSATGTQSVDILIGPLTLYFEREIIKIDVVQCTFTSINQLGDP